MAVGALITDFRGLMHVHIVPVRQSPRTRTSIGTALVFAPDMAAVVIRIALAAKLLKIIFLSMLRFAIDPILGH